MRKKVGLRWRCSCKKSIESLISFVKELRKKPTIGNGRYVSPISESMKTDGAN